MKFKTALFLITLSLYSLLSADETPSYRYAAVFDKHVKTLEHLERINPPLMLFISGAFGMGKTETAKEIEKRFQAVRINGDQMRSLLVEENFSRDEVNDYLVYCLSRLHQISSNRMFIIDRTFDDNRELYLRLTEEYGSPIFTIRLKVPKEIALERVINRGKDAQFLQTHFEDSYKKYQLAEEDVSYDYVIDNSQSPFHLDEALIQQIERCFHFNSPKYGTRAFKQTRDAIIEFAETGTPVSFSSHFSTILPGLYVGNQKSALAMDSDDRKLITDIISCRSKPGKVKMNSDNWLFLKIEDTTEYSIQQHFDEAYAFIENAQKAVFVHCLMGSSRSTAIATAYLMKKYMIPFSTAYTYIKKKHPRTQAVSFFEKQLLDYEEELGL